MGASTAQKCQTGCPVCPQELRGGSRGGNISGLWCHPTAMSGCQGTVPPTPPVPQGQAGQPWCTAPPQLPMPFHSPVGSLHTHELGTSPPGAWLCHLHLQCTRTNSLGGTQQPQQLPRECSAAALPMWQGTLGTGTWVSTGGCSTALWCAGAELGDLHCCRGRSRNSAGGQASPTEPCPATTPVLVHNPCVLLHQPLVHSWVLHHPLTSPHPPQSHPPLFVPSSTSMAW